jgi:hypothetical protein
MGLYFPQWLKSSLEMTFYLEQLISTAEAEVAAAFAAVASLEHPSPSSLSLMW